ncbi:MAG: neuraminidase-like domain-containing protein [Prochloraceae cyanobacterium]|nr:neuraminidase-like domain-containing protein [Prochloraceae cyanobacterium]
MTSQPFNLETRINILNTVLSSDEQQVVDTALRDAEGDLPTALSDIEKRLSESEEQKQKASELLPKVSLAYSVADLSEDNEPLVRAIAEDSAVNNLRDMALNFNVARLAAIVDPQSVPETMVEETDDDEQKKQKFAVALQHKLFAVEPTAVLQRMVQEEEVPITDTNVRAGVVNFLANQPDFNIHTTSVYTALQNEAAFTNIAEEQREEVVNQLKNIQRVQAISPIPEAVTVLMDANLISAFTITEMPESTFIKSYSNTLGEETARQVYTNALNNRIRNEQALISMRETVRGTGLAIMDGSESLETRMDRLQKDTDKQGVPLNLEKLFGDMDFCECEECASVYSPAAYFVELLQFLRNNNLDPKKPNTGQEGIANTPLEKLFRRRPDLGCLELTCENTFTVLPYVDLVNEVMESFVVHLDEYEDNTENPKQATLETFNVDDETSSELLAQPQHTNYQAYCILKSAVYPFTLPYHQPIDAIRIFLNYLETSRYELQDKYRTTKISCENVSLTSEDEEKLQKLHQETLDRAADAEFPGLTQEEYIILTKEAFWQKEYFDITLKQPPSKDEYLQNIGVKPVHKYYGYSTEPEMLSTDENQEKGLTFVKKQFLPRTGIQYVDLVELLKTQFINPNFPQGRALTILESIRFSYRFLQKNLVDNSSSNPKVKFAKLIAFLETFQPLVPLINAFLHPDPCQQQKPNWSMDYSDLRNWVYCYFERIGKLIVLDSGEEPKLPIEGKLYLKTKWRDPGIFIGTLHNDGTIKDSNGEIIGNVTIFGQVVDTNGKPFIDQYKNNKNDSDFLYITIKDEKDNDIALIDNGSTGIFISEQKVTWLAQDTCNLDKVRLIHLDGTKLKVKEYDRIQRFIRLWHKMGWTIDETDKALIGLDRLTADDDTSPKSDEECDYVGFEVFKDDCSKTSSDNNGDYNKPTDDFDCPDLVKITAKITPDFLHQLVAVKKLLDKTGLELAKLLTFWANISTNGEKSLYKRLFLTHNLLGIDKVFKPDRNGNYLTESAKISEHLPVLMAALRLKADDITAIAEFRKLKDDLTLANVSVLYRHSLLAKVLGIKVTELFEAIELFGEDPFKNAYNTLEMLKTWGKMENAGFSFRQLNYIIDDRDDALRPVAPSQRTILQITKMLYDGLNAIESDHKDVREENKEEATAELVRAKTGLFFEPSVVEQIINLLEGKTVYATNAPLNLTINIPESQKTLANKLKYSNQKDATPPSAGLQVTGILTEEERTQAKALSSDPNWAKAIDRVSKQPQNIFNDIQFFNNARFGIFPNPTEIKEKLLAGDVLPPDGNTALDKRFYFLKYFLPFLRRHLAHRLIVDTLAGAMSLPTDITDVLLSDLLKVEESNQSAISILENIKARSAGSSGNWKGYMIPPTDEAYAFIAISETQPPPLILDGEIIPFKYQQEDPSNVWSTDLTAKKLKSGKLYWLEVSGQQPQYIQWKTVTLAKTPIPTSALLPDYSQGSEVEEVFKKLSKAALLVNGFNLSTDEISYWQNKKNSADFDDFDFNKITLPHWKRLHAYTTLRNSLPRTETNLLDLFNWAKNAENLTELSAKIAAATVWKKENIEKLIQEKHFDLNRLDAFCNEVNLVKLQKALAIADKIGVDIDRLFEWAKPTSKFWVCHQIAEDIRKAIRARFDREDWEQVVKPLNDELRNHQKQALIDYLLVQPVLREWGVVDADSLFEFFLIDVQMDTCMETSRIKQGISSIQLFIQRCLLGLEEKYGVDNQVLDRDRWEWMQRYRVWEANRKVFLYPENWIEPELRDDKSPFYMELESELLQKDIDRQTVQDAIKSYLFKVYEVANLKVVGLYLDNEENKLHIFSRTRNAPYFFYYRYFHIKEGNWYPWEKVQVDIPSYDRKDEKEEITENGTYLIPVVWNKRLLIFFPQFMKKTSPNLENDNETLEHIGKEKKQSQNKPNEFWEIKMGWSEYRNGKWTQKQLSAEAIYHFENLTPRQAPEINSYEFIPRIFTNKIVIEVYRHFSTGSFHFTGSQIAKNNVLVPDSTVQTDFHYINKTEIHSLQTVEKNNPLLSNKEPYFNLSAASSTAHINSSAINFHHPFADVLLGKITSIDLDSLYDYYLNKVSNIKNDSEKEDFKKDTFGKINDSDIYHELKRTYSLYNWEAAFHAPMLLVDRLLKSQQFEQALKMCHYVFNPMAKGSDNKRFWQFLPFKEIDAKNFLERLFNRLQPNQSDKDISEWREKPFQPHVVARQRPVAYMKWVVMKYIEILIAWGDYLFRQDTIETLNQATQLYILAAHIYGPRGQKIPKRGKIQPQTYKSLLDKWDAFGNAMVELELAFPFSNQTPFPIGVSNGVIGLANVFGFATSLYFCIPDNPKLRGLRKTIDDRLLKIRSCQNIEGVFRKLPLFEPPIDPALLVQAAAKGLSLSSVLNDLNTPAPNYRFYYLLQKALELCTELKSLGNAFLSAKEKKDAEALSQLRASHESSIHNLVMEVRKQQLEEANKSLKALQQNRISPVYRLQHYLQLIGEDLAAVPDSDTDFNELANQIEPPIEESSLKLISYEKEEMDKASAAADWQIGIGITETLASILHIIPSFQASAQPFGIGMTSVVTSGWMLGNAAQAVARGLQTYSNDLSYQSTNASRKGGFLRQLQDRVQQANIAGYEIKNIDKQILTQEIRINIAQQEITNQQKQIDNAQEVEEFLRNKYTNQELYAWMEGEIKTLYYQAYTLAYDIAKKAEKVFRFERGLTTSNFIQFGYWDAARDGLLAGERLYLGLKQLEAAYQEKRGYDYEVSKSISLRQINPLALLQLKETGTCEFALPEVLFDMDFPGHYMRRIKSVALTIPCVVGPYTSLNCTLRLLEHKFRTSAIAKDKNDYPEKIDKTDDRFSSVNVPIKAIAVSTGQNDSGVFELNFQGDRYLPFEGAGAISKWKIELPSEFRQFDYDTITDVVLQMRYTAVEGGDKLKKPASDSVLEYIKSVEELSRQEGLFAAFDLKHEFASEWYKAMNPPKGATERVLTLNNLSDRLPIFTKGRDKKIQATDIYLVTPLALTASKLRLKHKTREETFNDTKIGSMKSFVIKEIDLPINDWEISIQDVKTEIDKLWLLVRYVLK